MGHHFFVSPSDVHDGVVELTGPEAHHAAHALRVRKGEAISVADGTGRVLDAVVTNVGAAVQAEVRGEHLQRQSTPVLTLHQGVPKGTKMDVIVEKAVEIGVARIVPFVAERTIVRWDEAKRSKARTRWTEIARSAAKQCRSPWLTQIDEVRDGVDDIIGGDCPIIVLHESATVGIRKALPLEAPQAISLVIGPEGGLSQTEIDTLIASGASIVTLGDRILRTETAGLVAATVVGFAYGTLG